MFFFVFFNDTATTEIYTLSLHDALPIWPRAHRLGSAQVDGRDVLHAILHRDGDGEQRPHHHHEQDRAVVEPGRKPLAERSEEHTSELQSRPISRMPSSA